MCYSVAGRIQTRLVSLLVPALLAVALFLHTHDPRYYTMLIVMVLVGLDLDLTIYPRLLRYQARWQTYLLGAAEFLVTLFVVRTLDGTLPLSTIIWYYLASWIGGQLVANAMLPILDLRWAEHGGELYRPMKVGERSVAARYGLVSRAWAHLASAPHGTLVVVSLLFLTVLDISALPTTITPLDAFAGPIAAVCTAWAIRRVSHSSVPATGQALALGLIMDLLIRSADVGPYLLGAALAVAVCAWVRLGGKPVFNSAAAAFVVLVLLVPTVYSAEGQWGNSLFLPLVIINLAVVIAVRRGTLPLLLAFGVVLLVHGWLLLGGRQEPLQILLPQLIPASVLFFGGFVLPEPDTSPGRALVQIVMGASVAATAIGLQGLGIGLAFAVSLLVWNYVWRLGCLGIDFLGTAAPWKRGASGPLPPGTPKSRRVFLGSLAALGGAVWLGGSVRRLTALDAATLELPPEAALAGGEGIPRFKNVAAEAGIDFIHHGDVGEGSPAIGTGVAWSDFDHSGRLSLYVTDHMGACHLYRNNGNGTFTDVAEAAGVAHPGHRATSATFVDYDNDGWPDLYVGIAFGPNVLYHNNRDGTFGDVSERSGLGDLGRTMSTAWADYDGDGYLDVFVANYSDNPITFDPNTSPIEDDRYVRRLARPRSNLYHNNGDGTFKEVTNLLGQVPTSGFGFSAVWLDYNNDGWPDLYVAYDFGTVLQPNTLWRNDGPDAVHGWRFQVEEHMGVAAAAYSMGTTSGDYNNDGWLDLAVSNIGPNMLYRNREGRPFVNVAESAGVAHSIDNVHNMLNPSMSWGGDFADLNNDGWLDLYMVKGSMYFENVPQPNELFINDHAGGFIDVSAASGANDPGQGRSVAVADYDGDGRLDLAVANYGQSFLLYRNVANVSTNNWIRLELEGTRSNRDAAGARAHVIAMGLRPQMREVQIGQGLGSCDAKALHFGLGAAKLVHRIVIRWPSGKMQVLRNVQVNQILHVREPGVSRWV